MTVRFGMVGTGAMAVAMLPAFRHVTGAELCAVSSSHLERAQSFRSRYGVAKAYGSVDDLLKDSDIDAIYIANRTRDHADTSIAALQAGKHVLCEKPFAMNATDGARVIDAARDSGKLFMDAVWTLFLPSYRRAVAAVSGQEIGSPLQLVAGYGYPVTIEAKPRLFDKTDGGVLLDLGVYPISLALLFLGTVDHLSAALKRNKSGIDTHLSLQMQHTNGATSQLVASFDVLASNAAFVGGSQGQIRIPAPLFGAEDVIVEPLSLSSDAASANPSPLKAMLKQNPLLRRVKKAFSSDGEHHPYGANQYLPQMAHFVEAIAAGKTESDIVTHDLSLNILKVIDQIRASEGHGS